MAGPQDGSGGAIPAEPDRSATREEFVLWNIPRGGVSDYWGRAENDVLRPVRHFAGRIGPYTAELEARLRARNRPEILFGGILADSEFNALAEITPGRSHFVAINEGVISTLVGLSFQLWKNTGTPAAHRLPTGTYFNVRKKSFRGYFVGPVPETALEPFLPRAGRPRNAIRDLRLSLERLLVAVEGEEEPYRYFRIALGVAMALDFVLHHELCHAVHAHLHHTEQRFNMTELSEKPTMRQEDCPPNSHVMEHLADWKASVTMGRYLAVYGGTPNAIPDIPPGISSADLQETGFGERETTVLHFAFCTTILLIAFELEGRGIEHFENLRHPHPEVRIQSIYSGLMTGIGDKCDARTFAGLKEAFLQGYHEAVRSFAQAGMSGRFFPSMTDVKAGYLGDRNSERLGVSRTASEAYRRIACQGVLLDRELVPHHLPILTGLKTAGG